MSCSDVIIEMEKLSNLNSGLGQFCLHLGSAIKQENKSLKIKFYTPKANFESLGSENRIYYKWWHRYFGVREKCKIWHGVHQNSVFWPSDKSCKKILTVHDLNFLDKYEGKKREKKRRELQNNIDRCDVITVISEFTKDVLRQNVDCGNKKIVRIYNGNTLKKFDNPKKPSFVGEGNYLFSIGIFSEKKNFEVLLPFIKKLDGLKLIIAGNHQTSYGNKMKEMIRSMGLESKVILPGEISDEEKYWLYRHCSAFVFPSLSEGFGLPVIEAMSNGKPTFISNKSSLPEVGGPEAFYFESFNPDEMAAFYKKQMQEFVFDLVKPTRMIWHAETFSWEKAAKEYLDLYKKLLN